MIPDKHFSNAQKEESQMNTKNPWHRYAELSGIFILANLELKLKGIELF